MGSRAPTGAILTTEPRYNAGLILIPMPKNGSLHRVR